VERSSLIEERGKNASTETRRDAEGRRGVLFARARRKRFSSSLRSFFYTNDNMVRLRLCSLYLILIILLSCELTRVRARARASARARFPSRGGSEKEKVSFSIHPERVISPLVKVSRGKIKISRFDFINGVERILFPAASSSFFSVCLVLLKY